MNKIQLLTGSSHPLLAKKIASRLKINLTPIILKKFADGEIYLKIEKNVRGDDVFIIQTLSNPVNENLMELLIMIDALKRSSVGRINLICPYLCYSRQDRKVTSREPISAKLIANLIVKAGADRLITVDLHAEQIQGFYDIPVDHFVGYPLFAKYLKPKNASDWVIVSPDVGGARRVNKMADLLGTSIAIVDKVRTGHHKAEILQLVGDVKGKTAVILDDMIDTGGSTVAATQKVKQRGAKKIIVCATHALFSNNAQEKLAKAPIDQILLLDTIPLKNKTINKKLKVISLAPLLSKIIKRVHSEKSLGELFTWEKKQKIL